MAFKFFTTGSRRDSAPSALVLRSYRLVFVSVAVSGGEPIQVLSSPGTSFHVATKGELRYSLGRRAIKVPAAERTLKGRLSRSV